MSSTSTYCIPPDQIRNLVFEGGGVKGTAFAGAIQRLDELKILPNVKRVAGSSAGAVAASLIAMQFSTQKIRSLLSDTDFKQFSDHSNGPFGWISNMWRLGFKYAWNKGDALTKWLDQIFKEHTGNGAITFEEVYQRYGVELVVTGCNINKAHTVFFHHVSYPDLPVKEAVRISMSIPLYYKPIRFEGDLFVDGGLLDNYPIWIFDSPELSNLGCCDDKYKCPCIETLGLKLMGQDETANHMIFNGKLSTNTLYAFTMSLLDCLSWQVERSAIHPGYWERTVPINTFEIKTTDFNMSDADKRRLQDSGYNAVDYFFKNGPGTPLSIPSNNSHRRKHKNKHKHKHKHNAKKNQKPRSERVERRRYHDHDHEHSKKKISKIGELTT